MLSNLPWVSSLTSCSSSAMLPHYCTNQVRNLTFPLISRVSKWRRFCLKSMNSHQFEFVRNSYDDCSQRNVRGNLRLQKTSKWPIRCRRNSIEAGRHSKSANIYAAESDHAGIVLDNRARSWEQSAEKYFSRNGGGKLGDGKKAMESSSPFVEPVAELNSMKYTETRSRFDRGDHRRWNESRRQNAKESSVPKIIGQCVYGVSPVLAALTAARREFYALYIQQGLDFCKSNSKKKDKNGIEEVLQAADKMGIKVIEASKHDLNMAADNRPHQGLLLDASPLELVTITELESCIVNNCRAPLWVALDEVTDPQNLGAVIRSAYFFGAEGIVICDKNSAPLSGVVCKASAGSLELIELRSCKNMMKFLMSSSDNGWRVLGGSTSSKAIPLGDVVAGKPTILVMGSEGRGLRTLVERSCTQLVRIPGVMAMDGGGITGAAEEDGKENSHRHSVLDLHIFHAVESLNVSVAAGVLLYHLVEGAKNSAKEKMKETAV